MLACLLVVVMFVGCCSNPPNLSSSVPGDLYVVYSYGACHAEKGRTNFIIDAEGNGVYESGSGSLIDDRFENERFRKTFKLDDSELLSMLNEIEASGFYSLENDYTDLDIYDGGCAHISVTKENKTKTVSVSNTQAPGEYSKVADLIARITEEKTSG